MKSILATSFLFGALFLNGCSVVTYDLRDELAESNNLTPCDMSFSLDIQGNSHTNPFGATPHETEALTKLKNSYISSTLDTLIDLGCNAKQIENTAESNLSVHVSRQLQLSALPQEWLTGLSFGLIPSWGTKYGQYDFTFTHNDSGKTYSYKVDQNNYNHLVLFPIFWVSFFTANEQDVYKDALTNFIKSN